MMRAATFFDGEEWREGSVALDGERMLVSDERPASDLPRMAGAIIGGFTDHHVHLQLVDHTALAHSTLARVIDLGADPGVIASYAEAARFVSVAGASSLNDRGGDDTRVVSVAGASSLNEHDRSLSERSETKRADHAVVIEFAGAFLTPVGGYPSDRDWAPADSWREIVDEAAAAAAVREMAEAGASCIKVASNAAAGPVFDDDLFRAIILHAAARRLPIVAHAEGRGEAQRAARLGATRLAHAPFTERLDDDEIAAQAASVSWVSTLAIHGGADLRIATDNTRRFHAAGGTVLYGTDMGNGPAPVGLNPVEIAVLRDVGIRGVDLLRALAPQDPRGPGIRLLHLPDVDAAPTFARPLTIDDLKA
nr:hypothetical protein [uncultured Microbacterium sp.]